MPCLLGARASSPPLGSACASSRRVAFGEVALRDWVKQAGGTWNPERRLRQLRYDRVVALGLNHRIVSESVSTSRCQR